MLILSRHVGESVLIGDDISITVLRIKGNQVRLGVNAPKSITVQRENVSERSTADASDTSDKGNGEIVPIADRLS